MSFLYDFHYTTNQKPVIDLDGPNFEFRLATQDDVDILVDLDRDAFKPVMHSRELTALCLSHYVSLDIIYVLTFRDDIIGTICIMPEYDIMGRTRGYIRNLAVFSRWRSMGVGSYLMKQMKILANELDCDYIALDIWPVPGLHRFYWKKMGMRYYEGLIVDDGPYKGISGTYYVDTG